MRLTHGPAVLVAVLLVVSLAVPAAAGTAVAQEQDPETAQEYFETFRSMEGTEAYAEYDEFETIRTFAVTQAQEAGQLEDGERAALEATLETMVAFREAYERAEAGEYEEALTAANETERSIAALEEHEETQAALATLALNRFYEAIGGELQARAEAADDTPTEMELLQRTARAYERAGLVDEAAEFRLQVEQRSAEYERDMERIRAAENGSEAFLEECRDCTAVAGVIGDRALATFEAYADAQKRYGELVDARDRAAIHGLDDREESLDETAAAVGERRTTLTFTSVAILLGYGVVVGLLGTVVFSRVFLWKRTRDAAQVGSVVQIGDSDV